MHAGRPDARRRANDIIAASPRRGSHNGDDGGQVDGDTKEMKRVTANPELTYIFLTSYIIVSLRVKDTCRRCEGALFFLSK